MVDTRLVVQQDSYNTQVEGNPVGARANPRGELVTADMLQQFVFDGRAYNVSNAARETATALQGTSFSDTAPAMLLDAPSGTTMIPLEIVLNQGGTVAGGDITLLVTLSDKTRYSSGGTQHTPQNLRYDEPNTASCKFYTAPTANANADDISLESNLLVADINGLVGSNYFWSARDRVVPVLVGPASLVIYSFAATTAPSWFFNITFAELSTTDVT